MGIKVQACERPAPALSNTGNLVWALPSCPPQGWDRAGPYCPSQPHARSHRAEFRFLLSGDLECGGLARGARPSPRLGEEPREGERLLLFPFPDGKQGESLARSPSSHRDSARPTQRYESHLPAPKSGPREPHVLQHLAAEVLQVARVTELVFPVVRAEPALDGTDVRDKRTPPQKHQISCFVTTPLTLAGLASKS